MNKPLETLALKLLQADIELRYMPADEENSPIEMIFIGLEDELAIQKNHPEELDYVLQLYSPSEQLSIDDNLKVLKNSLGNMNLLKCTVAFDIIADRSRLRECYQLINMFNQMLPIGYLDMDYEGNIYFTYTHITHQQEFAPLMIVDLLDKIEFLLPRMGITLTELHDTDKSTGQLMNEFVESIEQFKRETFTSAQS